MNGVNQCIISAILKESKGISKDKNYVHDSFIEEFINVFFAYNTMTYEAQEAFDEMYNECIDITFIQTELKEILDEDIEY